MHAPALHSCCAAQDVAAICGISAMPTFQVWKDGEKKDELVGASKDKLRDLINKYTADGEEPPPK